MLIRKSLLLFAATAAFAGIGDASAQTCRIAAGVSPSGVVSYRDVFEYDYVDQKPVFPGGDTKLIEFINNHRKYPREAYRKGIQGRVTCSFVVNADGSVSNFKVIRGAAASLNEEAIRVLKMMPDWQPGRIAGQAVPVRVIWNVPFRK